MSLECTDQAMIVTLNTEDPFTGRLYSQTAGKDCEVRGDNRTETQLSLEFDDASLARYLIFHIICYISAPYLLHIWYIISINKPSAII